VTTCAFAPQSRAFLSSPAKRKRDNLVRPCTPATKRPEEATRQFGVMIKPRPQHAQPLVHTIDALPFPFPSYPPTAQLFAAEQCGVIASQTLSVASRLAALQAQTAALQIELELQSGANAVSTGFGFYSKLTPPPLKLPVQPLRDQLTPASAAAGGLAIAASALAGSPDPRQHPSACPSSAMDSLSGLSSIASSVDQVWKGQAAVAVAEAAAAAAAAAAVERRSSLQRSGGSGCAVPTGAHAFRTVSHQRSALDNALRSAVVAAVTPSGSRSGSGSADRDAHAATNCPSWKFPFGTPTRSVNGDDGDSTSTPECDLQVRELQLFCLLFVHACEVDRAASEHARSRAAMESAQQRSLPLRHAGLRPFLLPEVQHEAPLVSLRGIRCARAQPVRAVITRPKQPHARARAPLQVSRVRQAPVSLRRTCLPYAHPHGRAATRLPELPTPLLPAELPDCTPQAAALS
jgi:hypothetical protein